MLDHVIDLLPLITVTLTLNPHLVDAERRIVDGRSGDGVGDVVEALVGDVLFEDGNTGDDEQRTGRHLCARDLGLDVVSAAFVNCRLDDGLRGAHGAVVLDVDRPARRRASEPFLVAVEAMVEEIRSELPATEHILGVA